MDHLPELKVRSTAVSQPRRVFADQAIFTSIRSTAGEGYRVAAASPGLTLDERAEITRRSPSHDSLCGRGPGAMGLAAYQLASERHCVAVSRHAGVEQSARGGYRVYTHVVLLAHDAFRAFASDPFRVLRAFAGTVMRTPIVSAPTMLPQFYLELAAEPSRVARAAAVAALEEPDAEAVARVAACLLEGGAGIVVAPGRPAEILEYALMALPVTARAEASFSVGVKFAPARALTCTVLDAEDPATRRSILGHPIRWLDAYDSQPLPASLYERWLLLVRRRALAGRLGEIETVTENAWLGSDAPTLNRIARLCETADALAAGEAPALEAWLREQQTQAKDPIEARVLAQLMGMSGPVESH